MLPACTVFLWLYFLLHSLGLFFHASGWSSHEIWFMCVCSSLCTRKHTTVTVKGLWNELVTCQLQWISELVCSYRFQFQKVLLCAEQIAGESICRNVHLTVAGSPSEKERGRGEERGSGTDLLFPTHENQMFSRTPRHPIFVMHQRPEHSLELFPLYSLKVSKAAKPAGPHCLSAQMILMCKFTGNNLSSVAAVLRNMWE